MRHLARILLMAALVWTAAAPHAAAQTYTATANATTQSTYPWIDISTTGTQVPLADDGVSGAVALGFNFTFGSTTYTSVRIAANGLLQFASSASIDYQNSALPLNGAGGRPNLDAAMLPLWDDLNPDGDGSFIRYRTVGTSPNRVFVVSWLDVPYYCSNSGSTCNNGHDQTRTIFATFQVQLHEQGHFVYRYGVVDGAGGAHTAGPDVSNPSGATVGYELTNSDYVQHSYRTASVSNNTTILWQRPSAVALPGGFNAFDTGTAAGSITGVIRTKVAGSAFNLAVVALNSTRTAVHTTFTGDVRVDLLDASDSTGTLNTSTGCRSSWTSVISTGTLNFATGDAGRDNTALTHVNSWRDVRVRVSYPATGTATVTGCSTDNFAIRPAGFNIAASDTTSSTANIAGTTRLLANTSSSGGHVHKAGRPFTVRATAVNASGTTTSNYNGTASGRASSTPCTGTACGGTLGALTLGTMTASGGQLVTHSASYSEAGAFNLQLVDDTFAAVDAADGSTAAEREISAIAAVGRFVPDHFEIVAAVTPVLRTFGSSCVAARSFTYLGQPFGYSTTPTATVYPRNAGGGTTTNYPAAKMSALQVTQAYGVTPASPGLATANAATPASPTANSGGTGTLQFPAGVPNSLTMTRPAAATIAPFTAAIALDWSVADGTESAVTGNETIATAQPVPGPLFPSIAFDQGNEFRYGQLKLGSAYGSELIALAVPVETQHWNGTGFVTNTADHCTALPTSSVSLANFRGSLAACETAPTASSVSMSSGRATMRLAAPGDGNKGSVDGSLQLAATLTPGALRCSAVGTPPSAAVPANLPWLQSRAPGGSTYDQNPNARFSFGQHRSPLIQLREMY